MINSLQKLDGVNNSSDSKLDPDEANKFATNANVKKMHSLRKRLEEKAEIFVASLYYKYLNNNHGFDGYEISVFDCERYWFDETELGFMVYEDHFSHNKPVMEGNIFLHISEKEDEIYASLNVWGLEGEDDFKSKFIPCKGVGGYKKILFPLLSDFIDQKCKKQ